MLCPDKILSKNYKDLTSKLEYLDLLGHNAYIIGELHASGLHATAVPTLIKRKEPLTFTPFAIPEWNGKSCEDFELWEVNELLKHLGWGPPEYGLAGGGESVCYGQNEIDDLLLEAKELQIEGFVLKNAHCSEWYKLKVTKTIDCVVIATETSFEPTHYGDMKSIIVSVRNGDKLKRIASVGSGFTAEFRQTHENLVGRIAEVQYDEVAANGQLKFPRFVRWREDKDVPDSVKDL